MAEFSRIVRLEKSKSQFELEASLEECKAIADRLDFEYVKEFKGIFHLSKCLKQDDVDCFCIRGRIFGKIFFENTEQDVEEEIELFIVHKQEDIEKFPILEDVELSQNGEIDFGEVMVQYLYLSSVEISP